MFSCRYPDGHGMLFFAEHGQESGFVNDGDSQGGGFFEFGRPHVFSSEHIVGFFRDLAVSFAAIAFNHGFVFVA